jgi:hypothetical protein
MVGMALMTISCAAGIAFYVRFLIAMGKESKPRWAGYLFQINSGEGDHPAAEPREPEEAFGQAA